LLISSSSFFNTVLSLERIAQVTHKYLGLALARPFLHILNRWRALTRWRKKFIDEVLSSWVHVVRCVIIGVIRLWVRLVMVAGEEGGLGIRLAISPALAFLVALYLDWKFEI
jgi:hypothetical protein